MKVIYVAGPYRSHSEYQVRKNIIAAEEAALFIWKNGGVAICPHKNTAYFGGAYNMDDCVWLNGDLELIKRCDALFVLNRWKFSEGTKVEVAFAIQHNIPVFFEGQSMLYNQDILDFLEEKEDKNDNPLFHQHFANPDDFLLKGKLDKK